MNQAIRLCFGLDDRSEKTDGPTLVEKPFHESEKDDRFTAFGFRAGYIDALYHSFLHIFVKMSMAVSLSLRMFLATMRPYTKNTSLISGKVKISSGIY
jgi:hypothetical protein